MNVCAPSASAFSRLAVRAQITADLVEDGDVARPVQQLTGNGSLRGILTRPDELETVGLLENLRDDPARVLLTRSTLANADQIKCRVVVLVGRVVPTEDDRANGERRLNRELRLVHPRRRAEVIDGVLQLARDAQKVLRDLREGIGIVLDRDLCLGDIPDQIVLCLHLLEPANHVLIFDAALTLSEFLNQCTERARIRMVALEAPPLVPIALFVVVAALL